MILGICGLVGVFVLPLRTGECLMCDEHLRRWRPGWGEEVKEAGDRTTSEVESNKTARPNLPLAN